MESSYEYVQLGFADIRQGVVLQFRGWAGAERTPHRIKVSMLRNIT
jgi:hypothetical protein